MRQLRVGMVVPIATDPTSYYRGVGPWSLLQKQTDNIQFLFPNPIDWSTLSLCDLLYMQRPSLPDHWNIMIMAKDMAVPVWVDFDDDNLAVPKDNPTYPTYCQMPVKDAIVKLARYADILTVSTEVLRKKYSIYSKNIHIIPNALDDRLMRHRQIPDRPREKMMLWRGTVTQQRNFRDIGPKIVDVANRNPDWKFGFFGYDPVDITEKIKNHQFFNCIHLPEYFKQMVALHSTALYYALDRNEHAQARSHVSWLEATFAGMAYIGPDADEFKRPGTLNFNGPDEFERLLESVIKGEVDIDAKVAESWAEIQDKYLLSKVNAKRADLLKQLFGGA